LQYEVQIEWDDGPRTGVIAQGLSEASLLVYERKIKHPLQIQRLTSNGFVI
jgi:hypothetical protein